jgi:hypothetical protein
MTPDRSASFAALLSGLVIDLDVPSWRVAAKPRRRYQDLPALQLPLLAGSQLRVIVPFSFFSL